MLGTGQYYYLNPFICLSDISAQLVSAVRTLTESDNLPPVDENAQSQSIQARTIHFHVIETKVRVFIQVFST